MNETLLQGFEWYLPADGLFWKKVKELAPSFRHMGITGIWLPPAYKGSAGADDVGYGVYDMYDLGEFDQKGSVRTKYGTKEEYLSAVHALQKEGISVIADIVMNHRMGGDEKEVLSATEDDGCDRTAAVSDDRQITAWTKFTFPGRKGKYDPFVWDHTCFDGTDWDENVHHAAVYRFHGKTWDGDVDPDNGNYDYLMGCDLDLSSAKVQEELKQWGHWYMDTVHPDALRLDAVKHMSWHFVEKWINDMRSYAGKDLWAVGEYWNGDLGRLLAYLENNHRCMSLFDVCLHYRFKQASSSNGDMDLSTLFDHTLVSADPMHAVTFVDNHDTQPGQALESFVQGWFKQAAYACILLREAGLPCVFWGDLYGIPHDSIPAVKGLARLIKAREQYAYGPQDDYLDDRDCIGWVRHGNNEHPQGYAVILTDRDRNAKCMHAGCEHAGEHYIDILENCHDTITVNQDGNAVFPVEAGSVSVWMPEKGSQDLLHIAL